MSGAAAGASASKFQSFMNHPAGALTPEFFNEGPTDLADLFFGGRGSNRAQDRLLLGPSHEVVPCCRGAERSQSTRGQTLCVAERRYVIPFLPHFLYCLVPLAGYQLKLFLLSSQRSRRRALSGCATRLLLHLSTIPSQR